MSMRRDQLLALLREANAILMMYPSDAFGFAKAGTLAARINAVLLVSAPGYAECGFVVCEDPFCKWTCGKPKGHAGRHSGAEKGT